MQLTEVTHFLPLTQLDICSSFEDIPLKQYLCSQRRGKK